MVVTPSTVCLALPAKKHQGCRDNSLDTEGQSERVRAASGGRTTGRPRDKLDVRPARAAQLHCCQKAPGVGLGLEMRIGVSGTRRKIMET